jgi:hypothetical protein
LFVVQPHLHYPFLNSELIRIAARAIYGKAITRFLQKAGVASPAGVTPFVSRLFISSSAGIGLVENFFGVKVTFCTSAGKEKNENE